MSRGREGAARRTGVFVVLLLLGVLYVVGIRTWVDRISPGDDFYTLHEAAALFAETGRMYGGTYTNLNNPHSIAMLHGFVGRLSLRTAFLVFSGLMFAVVLAAVPFLARARDGPGLDDATVALLLLAWPVTLMTVLSGQVGPVLLLLLAVAWWALDRGHDTWAGVALGVAVATKIFVGLFVPTLLVARRGRAAVVAAGTAVGAYALGLAVLGSDLYATHFGMLAGVDPPGRVNNGSLAGQLARWGMEGAYPVVALVVLLVVLWIAWRGRLDTTFGVTVTGMLLLSPLSWYYYMPLLIIPFLVALGCPGWPRWL
ncbi:MAG: glycosyltransferase family 87 protein, partial [Gemmatimonadota bacterium]